MSQSVIETVREFLLHLLPPMELELFDIQFRPEGHGWVLRVFIDAPTGVTLNHCSDVSRELGNFLDIEDCIAHAYHLEVSSPGLERPLRSTEEFKKYLGKKAKVKLHQELDGNKTMEGVIESVENDMISLKISKDKVTRFSFDMISKARLAI